MVVQRPWGKGHLMPYVHAWAEEARSRGEKPTEDWEAFWGKAWQYARQQEAISKKHTLLVYIGAMALLGGLMWFSFRGNKCDPDIANSEPKTP